MRCSFRRFRVEVAKMGDAWRPASWLFWLCVVLQSVTLCFCDTSRGSTIKSLSWIDIRRCNRLCLQSAFCVGFEFNHGILTCRLSNSEEGGQLQGESFVLGEDKSKESASGTLCKEIKHEDKDSHRQHSKMGVKDTQKQHSKKGVKDTQKQHSKKGVKDTQKQHSKKGVKDTQKQHSKKGVNDKNKHPPATYIDCVEVDKKHTLTPDVYKIGKGDIPFDQCTRVCQNGMFGIECTMGCYCHFIWRPRYKRKEYWGCRLLALKNSRCGNMPRLAIYNITVISVDGTRSE